MIGTRRMFAHATRSDLRGGHLQTASPQRQLKCLAGLGGTKRQVVLFWKGRLTQIGEHGVQSLERYGEWRGDLNTHLNGLCGC